MPLKIFKVAAVVRILCISLIFILDWLWKSSIPDTKIFDGLFKDGIQIEFAWYEVVLMFLIPVSFLVNSAIALLVSFRPFIWNSWFLKRKWCAIIFYWLEFAYLIWFFFLIYEDIKDRLFPEDYGLIGDVLKRIFPGQNPSTILIENLQLGNQCLLYLCSITFILLFWRIYRMRRMQMTE